MRKKVQTKATPPVRFTKDGQVWEVVHQTTAAAFAVRISKKGQAYGIIEKFYDYV
jgi:hypothetical protein